MKTKIEITEVELRNMIYDYMYNKLGEDAKIDKNKIDIMVKSKQNYRSEWEHADFKAIYEAEL